MLQAKLIHESEHPKRNLDFSVFMLPLIANDFNSRATSLSREQIGRIEFVFGSTDQFNEALRLVGQIYNKHEYLVSSFDRHLFKVEVIAGEPITGEVIPGQLLTRDGRERLTPEGIADAYSGRPSVFLELVGIVTAIPPEDLERVQGFLEKLEQVNEMDKIPDSFQVKGIPTDFDQKVMQALSSKASGVLKMAEFQQAYTLAVEYLCDEAMILKSDHPDIVLDTFRHDQQFAEDYVTEEYKRGHSGKSPSEREVERMITSADPLHPSPGHRADHMIKVAKREGRSF